MSKVADNWHKEWYSMLYEQEGLCKMEHNKGKVEIVDGIMLYISFVDTDELLCEIPYEYMKDFGITEKELKANASRLLKIWNGWDKLQAELKLYRESRNYPEIIKLKARLETAERLVLQGGAGHDAIVEKAVKLQKQRDALLTVIKRTEWVAMDNIAKLRCPICMNSADNGHRHDCELKKAIALCEK